MTNLPAGTFPSSVSSEDLSRLVTLGGLALHFSTEVQKSLTAIVGSAFLIGQAMPENNPMRAQLESIVRNSMRIKGIAQSALEFGRRRDGIRESCAPEELLREAVHFVLPRLENLDPPAAVEIEVRNGCPRVLVDRWQMVNVFVNLTCQAAEAMTVTSPRRLSITAHRENLGLVRFEIAGAASLEVKAGREQGLGLIVARKTIEEHRGSIEVLNRRDGAIFRIHLPGQLTTYAKSR